MKKIIKNKEACEILSAILARPDPTFALIGYAQSGDMAKEFPELQQMVDFETEGASKHLWYHVLLVVKNTPEDNVVLRWAALFHDVGKPDTYKEEDGEITFHGHESVGEKIWWKVANRIGVGANFARKVAKLIRFHLRFAACAGAPGLTDKAIRKLLRDAGDQLDNLYALTIADLTTSNEGKVTKNKERCKKLKERINKLIEEDKKVIPKLPKGTGHKLYDRLGLKGPALGEIMEILTKRLQDGEEITLDNVVYKTALILTERKNEKV